MFSEVCKDFITGKWSAEVDSSFDETAKQLMHELDFSMWLLAYPLHEATSHTILSPYKT